MLKLIFVNFLLSLGMAFAGWSIYREKGDKRDYGLFFVMTIVLWIICVVGLAMAATFPERYGHW